MKSPLWRQRFWKPSMSFLTEVPAAQVRIFLGEPQERIPLLQTFNLSFHFFLLFTMKRYFFLLAATILLASCSSDVLENANTDNNVVSHVTMTASDFELDAATRTALEITSSGLSFTWAESDVVGIYPNAGDQVSFPMTKGAGTKTANFDGGGWALKGNYTYAAYYPYDAGNTFYARPYTALPISYKGQKQPANNSTAGLGAYDYMVATASTPESGNVTFNFSHINSVLYIQLTSPDAATFTKLTLSCDDAIFVTDATVNISNGTLTPKTTANEITLDLDNVEISAGGVLKALMMIAPVNATGKTLRVTASSMFGKNYVAEIAGKDFQTGKGYMLSGVLEEANNYYEKAYLTFEALESTTFTFSQNALQYSLDGGLTWTTLSAGAASPTIQAGERIMWKANGLTPRLDGGIGTFSSTGEFNAEGNIMSLLFGDSFISKKSLDDYNSAFYFLFRQCAKIKNVNYLKLPATTLAYGCYGSMFSGRTSLISVPELPATTLAGSCYSGMFVGCTSLVAAPELPATTLATYCYSNMFNGCTSLTSAPELPATKMDEYCYWAMFYGCTNLTTAPELPATTLTEDCYSLMFQGCTSLTTAPALPATTLATYCYSNMFNGCTNLTTAPELPATSLASFCYESMFRNCTSLTTAPALPATTLATYCYSNMFQGCTSLTAAPELPAITLASFCYESMFTGCANLATAPELPATTLANNCFDRMFDGCTSLTAAPALPATMLANECYNGMFWGCTGLVHAPALPATTLAERCYQDMFLRCTSLTTAPSVLPATTLANNCYDSMFSGCTSLIIAPILPATTLASYCYSHMFNGCTSLSSAPELPATVLAYGCYCGMFYNCAGLSTIPSVLPATTLANYCYNSMFYGCTSLIMAPELPAMELVEECYSRMFEGCISLNYIKCLATNISAIYCTHSWVSGVAASGTFVKNWYMSMSSWRTGENGIPSGWTVQSN